MPPSPTHPPLPTLTQTFPSIPHPLGSFSLSATYLESPTFQLDDLESLLSSGFLDEGFVPTLTSKPRLDATASSSVTSQAESIAEKFVIPPLSAGVPPRLSAGSAAGSTLSSPGHGLSHLRQPSLPYQQPQPSQHQQHRSETSVPTSGVGSSSPSPTTLPALSRLRLESLSGRRLGSLPSPSSPVATGLPAFSAPPSTIPLATPIVPVPSSSTMPAMPVAVPVPVLAPISGLGLALGPPQQSAQGTPAQAQPHSASLLQSQSPFPQSPSLANESGTQALSIRKPSTINPFKTNTLLSGGTGGGSPAPGSGSGSGSGLGLVLGQGQGQTHGAPGTSAGSIHSIHSIHSVHSPRHGSSPLGLGSAGGGGESSSFSRSPPPPSALSHSSQSQQPFPTIQSSPHPPYSPPPQSGSSLGPSFGSGSTSSLGSAFPQSPSSPGQGQGQGGQPTPSTPTIPMLGQPGQRKRYSSSFSHRYTTSGSVGSATGVVVPGGSSTGSASPVGVSPALSSGLGAKEGRGTPSPGPGEDVSGKSRSRVRCASFFCSSDLMDAFGG